MAGLATGNFAQENIGELVAVLELFCGQEAGRRLSEAGVFFDHVEQTEMLQVFHALNAQRVRSHPLRTEEFSAMLRAFGRWQRAIAVYLDEYLPVQSLIDEAVDGYCAGRRFTFPALARANVARLLHRLNRNARYWMARIRFASCTHPGRPASRRAPSSRSARCCGTPSTR